MNAVCSAVGVMVPSQDTNATGLRVLLVNHSLAWWTKHSEVHEKHTDKVGASNC